MSDKGTDHAVRPLLYRDRKGSRDGGTKASGVPGRKAQLSNVGGAQLLKRSDDSRTPQQNPAVKSNGLLSSSGGGESKGELRRDDPAEMPRLDDRLRNDIVSDIIRAHQYNTGTQPSLPLPFDNRGSTGQRGSKEAKPVPSPSPLSERHVSQSAGGDAPANAKRGNDNPSHPPPPPSPESATVAPLQRRTSKMAAKLRHDVALAKVVGGTKSPTTDAPPSSTDATEKNDGRSGDVLTAMASRLLHLEKLVSVYQRESLEQREKAALIRDELAQERSARRLLDMIVGEQEREIAALEEAYKETHHEDWYGSAARASVLPMATAYGSRGSSRRASLDLFAGQYAHERAASQDNSGTPTAQQSTSKPGDSPQNANARTQIPVRSLPFDLAKLKENVRLLSGRLGSQEVVVQTAGGGKRAVMKPRDAVTLAVYRNGISVNAGLLRPYGWPLCDAILNDILDGYYPYEFKEKNPEGVPINIVDRSTEEFTTAGKVNESPAKGVHTLRSTASDDSATPSNMSRDEFLRKLPSQHVTASGKLIDIQTSVGRLLSGRLSTTVAHQQNSSSSPSGASVPSMIIAETPAAEALEAGAPTGSTPVEKPTKRTTSIVVRTPAGQRVLLHMFASDTVQDVQNAFIRALVGYLPSATEKEKKTATNQAQLCEKSKEELASIFGVQTAYDFCSSNPSVKVYTDKNSTLLAAGLVPSCTLLLRRSEAN